MCGRPPGCKPRPRAPLSIPTVNIFAAHQYLVAASYPTSRRRRMFGAFRPTSVNSVGLLWSVPACVRAPHVPWLTHPLTGRRPGNCQ